MRVALRRCIRPDAGEAAHRRRDVPLATHAPARRIARGVGMVHQHFMLVPTLTVAENVVLGREPRRGPFLDLGARRARGRRAGGAPRPRASSRAAASPTLSVGERSASRSSRCCGAAPTC